MSILIYNPFSNCSNHLICIFLSDTIPLKPPRMILSLEIFKIAWIKCSKSYSLSFGSAASFYAHNPNMVILFPRFIVSKIVMNFPNLLWVTVDTPYLKLFLPLVLLPLAIKVIIISLFIWTIVAFFVCFGQHFYTYFQWTLHCSKNHIYFFVLLCWLDFILHGKQQAHRFNPQPWGPG